MFTSQFKVDPRITEILGESYRSSEQAIKELIDNAWDADATDVAITLPEAMSADPIIIEDNGCGMTAAELEQEYLKVGRDRRSARGERTGRLQRLVKGRKGIGKFAGLMVADDMQIATRARGLESRLDLRKSLLLKAKGDFEEYQIPITEDPCAKALTGTKVVLSDLNQNLQFPNPDKLKAILVREYGRDDDFRISVNGNPIGIEDLPGQKFEKTVSLSNGGEATVRFTVVEGKRKIADAGIAVRVDGKVVGNPQLLGLEGDEVLPPNLVGRIYGEIEVKGMDLDAVTADGGGFVENNKIYQELKQVGQDELRRGLEDARGMEVRAAKARYQRIINRKLEQLPEYRRQFARRAFERVLERFYLESEEKFEAIISVVLDSLEHDAYWQVMAKIDAAKQSDVAALSEALAEFGLFDLSIVGRQAHRRKNLLDEFSRLIENPTTRETEAHRVLEKNLWLLEIAGTLLSSNESIRTVVDSYLNGKYSGERQSKRPDLLIAADVQGHHVIVELKRPSHVITRDDEAQAIKYRDDLQNQLQQISILLLGKGKSPAMNAINEREHISIMSYAELIGRAKTRLDWLIKELKTEA